MSPEQMHQQSVTPWQFLTPRLGELYNRPAGQFYNLSFLYGSLRPRLGELYNRPVGQFYIRSFMYGSFSPRLGE